MLQCVQPTLQLSIGLHKRRQHSMMKYNWHISLINTGSSNRLREGWWHLYISGQFNWQRQKFL